MLGIGRGLMTGGRVFMIDEPSLGLTPRVIDEIHDAIEGLKREGKTILVVEESASRAIELADRMYLFDHGGFVWQGTPNELETREEILATYIGG